MNRISELRKASRLSQADLAKFLNVTQGTISKYELDQINIPVEALDKLCIAFDCSADYLLGRSDIKKPPVAYSDERPNPVLRLDGPGSEPSDIFMRVQEANKLFLQLDDIGKAQALAYLQFLAAQQAKESDVQG